MSMDVKLESEKKLTGKINSFEVDKTLTKKGMSADAKVTGDKLSLMQKQLDNVDAHYAKNIMYDDKQGEFELGEDNLQGAVDKLKKSVADGKSLLANTISEYGYTTVASNETFENISSAIDSLVGGIFGANVSPMKRWTYNIDSPEGDFKNICFENDVWVVGSDNGLYYSIDGKTWIQSNVTSGEPSKIMYGGNIWLANIDDSLYYSTDGKTWTQSEKKIYLIDYLNYTWIGQNISDLVTYYSSDGLSWEPIGYDYNVMEICYGNNMWVASDLNGVSYTPNWMTDDWSQCIMTLDWNNLRVIFTKIRYGNNMWVACGDNGKLYYSYDGKTWNQGSVAVSFLHSGFDILCYGNGRWVVGCKDEAKGIYYSTDGETWFQSNETDKVYHSIDYCGGIFVACSKGGGLRYSLDGKNWLDTKWTNYRFPEHNSYYKCWYGNNMWVAGMTGTRLCYAE